ncbi:hypothetical protein BDV97DRAFT_107291 [Delphinella strobiligena]|nr:hypothetical protein BDV97DRAFT_107291 [Delphinella strobiligena]
MFVSLSTLSYYLLPAFSSPWSPREVPEMTNRRYSKRAATGVSINRVTVRVCTASIEDCHYIACLWNSCFM